MGTYIGKCTLEYWLKNDTSEIKSLPIVKTISAPNHTGAQNQFEQILYVEVAKLKGYESARKDYSLTQIAH